jgi:hypothetical protein
MQQKSLNMENDTNVVTLTASADAEPSELEIEAERHRRRTAWQASYAPLTKREMEHFRGMVRARCSTKAFCRVIDQHVGSNHHHLFGRDRLPCWSSAFNHPSYWKRRSDGAPTLLLQPYAPIPLPPDGAASIAVYAAEHGLTFRMSVLQSFHFPGRSMALIITAEPIPDLDSRA